MQLRAPWAYIVGYSRGAITARALAQMISDPDARDHVIKRFHLPDYIKSKVEFLGLFDPVIGAPYFFKKPFSDENAVFNEDITSYVEILPIDENLPIFQTSSAIEIFHKFLSKRNIPQIEYVSVFEKLFRRENKRSITEVVGQAKVAEHGIKGFEHRSYNNRRFILMPGLHGDIGGQKADTCISANSFQTMIDFCLDFPNAVKISSLCPQVLQIMSQNASQSQNVKIGGKQVLLPRFRRTRLKLRKYPTNPSVFLHSLVDQIDGAKIVYSGEAKQPKRYAVPREYHDITRFKIRKL